MGPQETIAQAIARKAHAGQTDKAGAPYSVCAERTPGKPDFEQGCTLAGIVMDATDCRLWVRRGNDPAVPYTEYTWSR